jgi:hypothetical protein
MIPFISDVYTSYDYSACIREFGMISSRGRNLRKTMLLTRSFDPYFTKTERVTHPNVHSSLSHTINLQRVAIANDQDVLFTFFRNFDRKKRETFDVTVETKGGNYTVGCHLPYKASFIAIGNYTTKNDLHLVMSTIPILTRVIDEQSNDEVWIVETNTVGAMIFEEKEFTMIGNMQDDNIRHDGASAILSFERTSGWAQIKTATGSLYIIGLAKEEASTLFAEFEEPYWNNGVKKSPALVAWGADTFFYNKKSRQLEIEYRTSNTAARILSFSRLSDPRITSTVGVYDLPFIQTLELPKHAQTPSIYLTLDKWEKRVTQFDQLPWAPLKSFKKNGAVSFDAIDYQYTSGHILYRNTFTTPASQTKVTLSLNIRHRATVILNGQVIGGHTTYSRQLFNAGAKIGPDPWFFGTQKYDLTPHLSNASNQLVILVDSFGLSRQAFIMNDVRNPKGITGVSISGLDSKHFKDTWEITGVDVRKLDIPYTSTGFPDEEATEGWAPTDIQQANQYTVPIPTQGVQWFKCQFDDQHKKSDQRVPLRLHFDGEWTAMAFLNDVFIARYYGNGDGPQHDFYLPDELVKPTGNQIKILAYAWKETQGQVSVEGWPVLPDTGNLVTVYPQNEKPEEFMVYKDSIHL